MNTQPVAVEVWGGIHGRSENISIDAGPDEEEKSKDKPEKLWTTGLMLETPCGRVSTKAGGRTDNGNEHLQCKRSTGNASR